MPIPWQLHEFAIAPGKLDAFLHLWRTRLAPLADRHGPCIVGCWLTPDQNRFVWLTSCIVHPTDDALAESWPAMLVHHNHVGTMDVSRPLTELAMSPLTQKMEEGILGWPYHICQLNEDTCVPDGCASYLQLCEEVSMPLCQEFGIDVLGAWQAAESNHFLWLTGFADARDREAKHLASRADPRWQAMRRGLDPVVSRVSTRLLVPCDFSPTYVPATAAS